MVNSAFVCRTFVQTLIAAKVNWPVSIRVPVNWQTLIAAKVETWCAVTAFDHVSSSQSRWIAADSRHATRICVTDVDTIKQSMIFTTSHCLAGRALSIG